VQAGWRWTWYLGLSVVACIASVAQIDRHAHEVPSLAKVVPKQFRDFALIRQAAVQAVKGKPDDAVVTARDLIAHHPIPAENLTILAIAEQRAGNEAGSADALMLAAQRGWREPQAQRAVALAAMQSGEAEIAADRLSALWRTMGGRPYARDLTEQLFDSPEVRRKFAAKLGSEEPWIQPFLMWSANNLSLSKFATLVEDAHGYGARFDCGLINKTARAFLEQGARRPAQNIWVRGCGKSWAARENDLAFSYISSKDPMGPDPFSWIFPSSVGLTVNITPKEGAGGIDFENSDPIRRLLAKKYLALSPGTHVIRVRADKLGPSARPLLVRFKCNDNEKRKGVQVVTQNVVDGPLSVEVPVEHCDVQSLSLLVDKGVGRNVRLILD